MTHWIYAAPLVGVTDRHCLFFYRLLAPNAHLFTQMYPAPSVIYRANNSYLEHQVTGSVAVQIAASTADEAARAATIVNRYNYSEINLNLGCPSKSATNGGFGACQFNNPRHVADICHAIKSVAESTPLSIKIRLGVDGRDTLQDSEELVLLCQQAGVDRIYVHARKALLSGISPAANRSIPPIRVDMFEQLSRIPAFAQCVFCFNGGIKSVHDALQMHQRLGSGIMMGRLFMRRPLALALLERGQDNFNTLELKEVLSQYREYALKFQSQPAETRWLKQPLMSLVNGFPDAKKWRECIAASSFSFDSKTGDVYSALTEHLTQHYSLIPPEKLGAMIT